MTKSAVAFAAVVAAGASFVPPSAPLGIRRRSGAAASASAGLSEPPVAVDAARGAGRGDADASRRKAGAAAGVEEASDFASDLPLGDEGFGDWSGDGFDDGGGGGDGVGGFGEGSDGGRSLLAAALRATEVASVLAGDFASPLLSSLVARGSLPTEESGGWEALWSTEVPTGFGFGDGRATTEATTSLARRLAGALEALGPTYVKFGQALGSRPDVVPPSLAAALSSLQDDMAPFDSRIAREVVRSELTGKMPDEELEALAKSLRGEPVAAASIGQVYKVTLPGKGEVAVKVQRPGVRKLVERDAAMAVAVARFLESLPAFPSSSSGETTAGANGSGGKLINTRLVAAAKEFMSRIFEELDYRNEASNLATFADLYSHRGGSSEDVRVVVPEVHLPWCTENVLVMEWIDGTKLTDVGGGARGGSDVKEDVGVGDLLRDDEDATRENLALVKVAIDATLSQLLVTGILHADPHAGNLLKVRRDDGSPTLGYLDFGLLSTIPPRVRDALVCAVALQVFERDVDAVSRLFGELRLIPQEVLDDEGERAALAEALEKTFENSLLYPDRPDGEEGEEEEVTSIPDLKFDKLLDSLSRLVPRFRFDLPPYFVNNARALSTLEGIAKSLDPSFNVLTVMYPYALGRMLQNPSGSPVVERTVQALIRDGEGRIDRGKVRRLLRDSASIAGLSKRRVVWDVVKTRPGRKLTRGVLSEGLRSSLSRRSKMLSGRLGKRRKGIDKWYYFQL